MHEIVLTTFNHVTNFDHARMTCVEVKFENILLKGMIFILNDVNYLYMGPMLEFMHLCYGDARDTAWNLDSISIYDLYSEELCE